MKNKYKLLFLILLLICGSILIYGFFEWYIVDVQTTGVDFKVLGKNRAGFNLDVDALHFGIIPPQGGAQRGIILINNHEFPVFLNIRAKGNASDYLSVEKNNFVLDANSTKSILFFIELPEDINYGIYNGTVTIFSKRALWRAVDI